MQKVLLIFALLALGAYTYEANLDELQIVWSSWKSHFGKNYALAEEGARFAIFVENYKYIVEFNGAQNDVKLALNKFADITPTEFSNVYAGGFKNHGRTIQVPRINNNKFYSFRRQVQLPTVVDWRTVGAVTPVKDQGQCGSCWSFSTTGLLEGFYFITNKKLVSFSEQQIVDCDTDQDEGCNGGLPSNALEYTAKAGLQTEDDYPYTATDGKCAYKKRKAVNTNKGYTRVATQSADALKEALVNSPVSIGIEADQKVFQFYSSGVIKKNCGDDLDHAVLAVGYTTVNGDEAFIVKNSWGTSWGQAGYVYISTDGKANNGNGVCGILGEPVIAN